MVSTVDALFGVGVFVGIVLCWFGYRSYRSWDELGVLPFAAFTLVLGVGALVSSLTGIYTPTLTDEPIIAFWAQLSIFFWILSAVPWLLFALQYTGRYTSVGWRTAGLLSLPLAGIVVGPTFDLLDIDMAFLTNFIGSMLFLYALVLVLVGVLLVVRTTYRYGHLSLGHGLSLSLPPVILFLTINTLSLFEESTGILSVGLHITGLVTVTLLVGVALFRYEVFDATGAIGTIGEEAIIRESDDLVFVVEPDDRIVKLNETALATLAVSRGDARGAELQALLDYDSEQLGDVETVTLQTTEGTRKYDPQVSALTDQHGREIGTLLSLRDVSERELREQRLSVLNRVLRHNLRNKIEVIKSHAEVLDDELDGDVGADYGGSHTETIVGTADEIAGLGEQARTIDRFVSDSMRHQRVDISAVVQTTLETLDADDSDVALSLDLPASATVTTNQTALAGALESAIENALAYAESHVSITVARRPAGYRITIADDGPGIPDSELETIERGTETALQHGTGLGLWQLRWAVRTMDGALSFDTTDGTTVELTVPTRTDDQGARPAGPASERQEDA